MPGEQPRHRAGETRGQPSWIAPVKPVVPDHELLKRIGGGSYGDVWLARNVVGAWRAVKVVFRDRFLEPRPYEREFNGIQKFEPLSRSNEGFVDVLQIGRNDTFGYFYYVMELADDASDAVAVHPETYVPKTLSMAMLQRGRLPVGECLELGITLNLALARLHSAGLIHRDIKPSNIIFVGGVPKLADIGLVIEFAEARSYVGTEGFIPPEGPNSPQADIYSLGKVLYEAGMGKDRKDFPEPPTLLAQTPDSTELLEFNAILLKACAANVKDRYPSAEAMNADLALVQSGGSVRRQRTLTRRLRSVQRVGMLVTALAAIIGTGWLWQARQTRLVRQLANEKTRLAEEKTKLSDENRERLVRLNIANGVRLLDQDDLSGALLWFADTLPLVAGKPAEEAIHRIRIQQVLRQSPRLLRVMTHESSVLSGAFSPDGCRVATGTHKGWLRVWDIVAGKSLWEMEEKLPLHYVRFSRDGRRLFVSCVPQQGKAFFGPLPKQLVEVVDAETGKLVFPRVTTNLVCCAFSPDDRWVAIARTDNTIQVLDAAGGRPVAELSGNTSEIRMLSFSADGSLIASASRDRTVRFWALPSGKPFGPTLEHEQPVQMVTFSSDGQWVATASQEIDGEQPCVIQVWNVESGAKVGQPHFEKQWARAMFFSPGPEHKLFTGGEGDGVRVWDAGTNATAIRTLDIPVVRCWAFSPDGQKVSIGTDVGFAFIWSIESGELLFPQFRHTGWVESVQFSPDGSHLLTTSDDATVRVWDLSRKPESARLVLSANLKKVEPAEVRFRRPTPGLVDVDLDDGGVHLVDPVRLVEVKTLKPQGQGAGDLAVEVGWTGRYWALVEAWTEERKGLPHIVTLWQKRGTEFEHFELPHPQALAGLAFYPDDTRLVTIGADFIARVWRSTDGELLRSIPLSPTLGFLRPEGYEQWIRPDGKAFLMMTAREGGQHLQLVDLDTGELTGKPFLVSYVNKARFSPDSTRLAWVGPDQQGHIVDLQSGRLVVPSFKHGGNLTDLDWSPDGKRLVTAGLRDDARLWDAATGQLVLSPMTGVKLAASWSADGRFIVTWIENNQARVWDAATTEAVTPRLRHSGSVRSAFMRGGQRLITASDPNLLRAWDLIETRLASDVIADYAHLLSGRKINASGVLLPLTPVEVERLQRSLQNRAPELFAAP